MGSWGQELAALERQLVFYDQLPPAGESEIAVLPGHVPVLISVPHSTRHWRNNDWKQEEEYTAALGYLLNRNLGVHFVYARYMQRSDPHDDDDIGFYKQILDTVISNAQAQMPIRLAIDLHGARGDRDFAIAIGTIYGETFSLYQTALFQVFKRFGFHTDPESSLDRIADNPARYTGGLIQPTITRYLWHKYKIPAVQIELNAWVRIVERLPNASNAKNGTAPRFRGEESRIRRVYDTLATFIEERLTETAEKP